jgi:hypothetical protein
MASGVRVWHKSSSGPFTAQKIGSQNLYSRPEGPVSACLLWTRPPVPPSKEDIPQAPRLEPSLLSCPM